MGNKLDIDYFQEICIFYKIFTLTSTIAKNTSARTIPCYNYKEIVLLEISYLFGGGARAVLDRSSDLTYEIVIILQALRAFI